MVKRLLSLATLTAIVSLALVACGSPPPEPAATPTPISVSPAPPPAAPVAALPTADPGQSSGGNGGGAQFEVSLQDPGGSGEYAFAPSEMTFSVGDTISFSLAAETEFHTFTVDDLGIDVSVDGETTETLSFTFAEAGTFELVCIPHEALGMVGTITVQ